MVIIGHKEKYHLVNEYILNIKYTNSENVQEDNVYLSISHAVKSTDNTT